MPEGTFSVRTHDQLRPELIAPHLKEARRIHWLERTDSTNEEAKRLAAGGDPGGVVIIAERQTAGKGRLGRGWESFDGQEVQMSFLLRPRVSPAGLAGASFAAGIGIAAGLRLLGADARLKWPNDVVVDGRKICGILIESSVEDMDTVGHVIVGTGVNVNQPSFAGRLEGTATSLRMETGHEWERTHVAAVLIDSVTGWMDTFFSAGLGAVMDEYRALSTVLDRDISVVTEDGSVLGHCTGFADDGRILVDCGGTQRCFSANDVSIRGVPAGA